MKPALRRVRLLRAFLLIALCGLAASSQAEGLDWPDAAGEASGLGLREPAVRDVPDILPRVPTVDLTIEAMDIWDRIARGFGMPDLLTDDVSEQQMNYLSKPAYLKRIFERGGPYLYFIVDELEERGMPTEIALLPMVESAFNPMARSHANAVGLWQFIPSTGKHFELDQNAWVDQRRDVVASTRAALDYLQRIYEMHGDWHLALASYNWGEGAVGRAIEKNRAAGLATEYAYLQMPAETRQYVPKLQALKNIVAMPELFGVALPHIANKTHFITIDSPAGMDLATAARHAEMPLSDFLALNPSFNRPILTGGPQALVVPAARAERFRANLAAAGKNSGIWRSYSVQRQDTLPGLATRFKVPVAALSRMNGLYVQARLRPGQSMLVPIGVDPELAMEAAQMLPEVPPPSRAKAGKGKKRGGKAIKGKSPRKPAAKAKSGTKKKKAAAPQRKPGATKPAPRPAGKPAPRQR